MKPKKQPTWQEIHDEWYGGYQVLPLIVFVGIVSFAIMTLMLILRGL